MKPRKFKFRDPAIYDDDGNMVFDGDRGRKLDQFQYGLIAQEVDAVLTGLGKGYNDFAGLNDIEREKVNLNSSGAMKQIGTQEQQTEEPEKYWYPGQHDYNPDHPDGLYQKTFLLSYTQFIGPMIKAIQELSAKVDALEKA